MGREFWKNHGKYVVVDKSCESNGIWISKKKVMQTSIVLVADTDWIIVFFVLHMLRYEQ